MEGMVAARRIYVRLRNYSYGNGQELEFATLNQTEAYNRVHKDISKLDNKYQLWDASSQIYVFQGSELVDLLEWDDEKEWVSKFA